VALKVVKAGMDTRQVIGRFEAERQALALMDHPNIAKVFDAGMTEHGRPYFVMELVKGVPITKYGDEHRLTPRQRLGLFASVCEAVQHAHQKGIIHRDIKPTNVLVAAYDDKAVPKVIDFGVAKARGVRLTERTVFTGFGDVIGTLEYMSPEQAELNQLDVDTRSDIYSLGVLLYELLTGSTPLDKKRLASSSLVEALRVIREEEPPRPSTRLSASGELAGVAACRGLEPKKLSGVVKGELDWIVMKCLEKDRARRYESAGALARDVERYLADEPVSAGPPSGWYRARKFARRHKKTLAMTTVLAGALLLAVGSFGWMLRDRGSRRLLIERQVTHGLDETGDWYKRDKVPEALAVLQQVETLIARSGGSEELRRRVSRWRVDLEMAEELERIRLETTAVKAEAFDHASAGFAYSEAFRRYGLDVDALDVERAAEIIRASAIRKDLVAALDDWTTPRGARLTKAVAIARRADGDPWRDRFRQVFDGMDLKDLEGLAREKEILSQPTTTVRFLSQILIAAENTPLAVEVLRKAQQRNPSDFWINHALAFALLRLKPPETEEAVGFFRVAVAQRPQSAGAYVNLGYALSIQGKLEEAIAAYGRAIDLKPDYATPHAGIGSCLNRQRNWGRAITTFLRAIELKPDYAEAHSGLGLALNGQHKWDDALAAHRKAVELKPALAEAQVNLGGCFIGQRKWDRALSAFRKASELKPELAEAHLGLGNAFNGQGKWDEAIAATQRAMELRPNDAETFDTLGVALAGQLKLDQAIAAHRRAIQLQPEFANAHNNLGIALQRQGKLEEATVATRHALALQPESAEVLANLADLLRRQDKLEEAVDLFHKAVTLKPDWAHGHMGLGIALIDQRRLEEAGTALRRAIALEPELDAAHYNLGVLLTKQAKRGDAINAYRRAIELNPQHADAHCNLGHLLRDDGQLVEALKSLKRGHDLGVRDPQWDYPSARWVAQCEELVALDARLSRVLAGEREVADAKERIAFGLVSCCTWRFDLAARYYEEAFAQEPALADDLATGCRFRAACAAALAGAGQGRDAQALGQDQRARRRRQAREWLRADLERHGQALEHALKHDDAPAREIVAKTMQGWLRAPDLRSLRDPRDLAGLPDDERNDCVQLWKDVQELLAKASKRD
jgi:tetratricopeptide (TPR) repeat protein